MSMNKMEELEFLIEVRDQTTGISYHDDMTVCCGRFLADPEEKKELTLKAEVTITMSRIKYKERAGYFESVFYDEEASRTVNKAVISKINEIINNKIKKVREEVRDILKIPEEKPKEGIEQDHDQEGDTI